MPKNFERMMEIVNEVFDNKNDQNQLDVDDEMIDRMRAIHPATMNELIEDDGPIVWVVILPTTEAVMHRFLNGEINESALVDETPAGIIYSCIYICSASVLPEHRNKGLAKKVIMDAIENVRLDHPIKYLYYWPFNAEGAALAKSVAASVDLQLFAKVN